MDTVDVGDVVEHTRFGIGTVLEIQGTGLNTVAFVTFGARKGTKRFLMRYALMEIVDSGPQRAAP